MQRHRTLHLFTKKNKGTIVEISEHATFQTNSIRHEQPFVKHIYFLKIVKSNLYCSLSWSMKQPTVIAKGTLLIKI